MVPFTPRIGYHGAMDTPGSLPSITCDACFVTQVKLSPEALSWEVILEQGPNMARAQGWQVTSEGDLICPSCICF